MTAMTNAAKRNLKPWYREPWPWLLMVGPFVVIVAGLTTAWLAVRSSDGLVTEDYYKQGQAAGETLSRSRHAEALGLQAGISLTESSMRVRLTSPQSDMQMPAGLSVTMSHPTRAGMDQKVLLVRDGANYAGNFRLPASGHWLVLIEDEARTWRLMGSVVLPAATESLIGGASTAEKPKL
jgi:hypothetical protein